MKCDHCDSEEIKTCMYHSLSKFGVASKKTRFGNLSTAARVCCDVCAECGTIVRTYVHEDDMDFIRNLR
ncbi:MAG: hypothetical protein LBS99_01575 [Clostridiales bacterium]|jgi:hypothetical protein|nr:hypothetical protein [Clostridiales bacterium]